MMSELNMKKKKLIQKYQISKFQSSHTLEMKIDDYANNFTVHGNIDIYNTIPTLY